ncbi:MAG: HAMP domain-containing sensor histidine kinase [Polyangiales bacterium]
MSLRAKVVASVAALSLLTLGGAFTGAYLDARRGARGALVAPPSSPGAGDSAGRARSRLADEDARLRRALALVTGAALLWTLLVAAWLTRRLTREHPAISSAVTRAAAGDLSARVLPVSQGAELDPLGRDVNALLARHDRLVTSQQVFVAASASELLTPLRDLYEALVVARRDDLAAAARLEALDRAFADAQSLTWLAEDLLTLGRVGRVGEGSLDVLSLRDVCLSALDLVRGYARARGVALGVDGDGSVRGRAADLRRMVEHLLDNAVRHSPPGAPVRVILREHRDAVVLRVKDQGEGVAEADRARVFDAFYQGAALRDDPNAGPGLGLAIVREIARAHGGDAAVEEPDPARRGATIAVTLPKA